MEASAVPPEIQLGISVEVGFESAAFIANEGVIVTPARKQSMLGLLLRAGSA